MSEKICFILLLLIACFLGAFVAGGALHDPDTCFLLTVGRFIFEHFSLPANDPFSYTYGNTGNVFVVYQWLSELIFYFCYRLGGLMALLAFCALVLCLAFLIIPTLKLSQSLSRLKFLVNGIQPGAVSKDNPSSWSLSLRVLIYCLLGLMAASFHFLVRPEIFSYLFLMLTVLLLNERFCLKSTNLTYFFILFIAWSNLHTGFLCGLAYIFFFLLALIIEPFLLKSMPRLKYMRRQVFLALLLALLGSVFNPYFIGLWFYLKQLCLVSFNNQLIELRPLTFSDLLSWTFLPYTLFLFGTASFLAALNRYSAKSGLPVGTSFVSLLLFLMPLSISLSCRRLIPFAVIFMLGAVLYQVRLLIRQLEGSAEELELEEPRLSASLSPVFVTVSTLVMTILGSVLMSSWIIKPELPQSSNVFHSPFEAIEYIKANRPKGNVFCDAQYGDVMLWYLYPDAEVFIDTRFDMYGEKIVSDYQKIIEAKPGWQETVKDYAIDWYFLPKKSPLAKTLLEGKRLNLLFEDKDAVIGTYLP